MSVDEFKLVLILVLLALFLLGIFYRSYTTLMPFLNAMNAPIWLYGYYIITAILWFYGARAIGLYSEDWASAQIQSHPSLPTPSEERPD